MPRRRGLRPRLLAAVIRSKATLAFAAERQVVSQTYRQGRMSEEWFRPYIEGIRRRPGMYLRIPTAAGLGAYVDGYRQAREALHRDDLCADEFEFVRRFQEWLRTIAKGGANFDWPMLVDLVVGHPASIDEFFQLWDRFHEVEGLQHAVGNVWPGRSPA